MIGNKKPKWQLIFNDLAPTEVFQTFNLVNLVFPLFKLFYFQARRGHAACRCHHGATWISPPRPTFLPWIDFTTTKLATPVCGSLLTDSAVCVSNWRNHVRFFCFQIRLKSDAPQTYIFQSNASLDIWLFLFSLHSFLHSLLLLRPIDRCLDFQRSVPRKSATSFDEHRKLIPPLSFLPNNRQDFFSCLMDQSLRNNYCLHAKPELGRKIFPIQSTL